MKVNNYSYNASITLKDLLSQLMSMHNTYTQASNDRLPALIKNRPGIREGAENAKKDLNDRLGRRKNNMKKSTKHSVNTLLSIALGAMKSGKIKTIIASGSPV
jgi:hypothetical protein